MTLDAAIIKYRQLKVASTITPSVEKDLVSFFKEIKDNIPALIKDKTEDPFTATLMFSELSFRKITGYSYIAYYYGSICQNIDIPKNLKDTAKRFRLKVLFNNLEEFDHFITVARTVPFIGYKGNLEAQPFLDFLIMSDAYEVWNSDKDDKLLKSIQNLVIKHESHYPSYTKQQIIKEGNLAHQALFNAVKIPFNNNL